MCKTFLPNNFLNEKLTCNVFSLKIDYWYFNLKILSIIHFKNVLIKIIKHNFKYT